MSVNHGSAGSSVQRYISDPMRCQLLPANALNVSPASLASSREKGRSLSAEGMRGDLPTRYRMQLAISQANPAC
jgi:hypothetical protein